MNTKKSKLTISAVVLHLFLPFAVFGQTATDVPSEKRRAEQIHKDKLALANQAFIEAFELQYLEVTEKSLRAAIAAYKRASELYREADDKENQAVSLGRAGRIASDLGDYAVALKNYGEALSLFRALKSVEWEAPTLSNIGSVYLDLGEKSEALKYFKLALPLIKQVGNKKSEAALLNNIGRVYADLDERQEALTNYEQALSLFRQIGGKPGEVRSLEQYEGKKGEAATLNNLGELYRHLGKPQKALEYLNQALPISRLIDDKGGEATTLNNIGSAYLGLGEPQEALKYYDLAFSLSQQIGDEPGKAATLANLMSAWESLKNLPLAAFYGKQSVNAYQQLRANIKSLDKELQGTFLKSVEGTYRKLADILIAEGRLLEAQAILDLLKEEEYGQLARSGGTADTVPYSRAESEVAAKVDNLVAFGREQMELRKQQKEQGDKFPADRLKRLDQLNADIKIANAEFDSALAALAKADPGVEARTLEIKGEKNLQSALQNLGKELNTGAVALYTVIGTEEEKDASGKPVKDKMRSKFGWVILVTPKDRKAYPIDVTNLEQTVFQFRNALSSDKYEPRPLAEKIYNAIFRQTSAKQKTTLETDLRDILSKHPNKTLMWSLDGVLRYIPMAALHDGETYLVEKYRHVTFTNESLLWLMNQPKPETQTLGLGVSDGNKDLQLSPLPGVDKELSDIIKQTSESTGILKGIRRLNKDFTKQDIMNLKDEDNSFQTVHIASHYSFSPTDINKSYLLIGDGKLTFNEMNVNNLFGSVDLLTLSACDTGVSGNGTEAEGFAYLAQSLGAKSVIASLWKVSDAGTPELMIRFYKLRAENPSMPKGEAFRQAQLSVLGVSGDATRPSGARRSEIVNVGARKVVLPLFVQDSKRPFAHPHYWASFVLIGNWR